MTAELLLADRPALTRAIIEDVRELVEVESPSSDLAATERCGAVFSALVERRLGSPPRRVEMDGRGHWRWGPERPRILLLGHLDTVWPIGTLEGWPLEIVGDRLTGPGVFDMKSGLVIALHAVAALGVPGDVGLLVTSDEEIGSPTSRGLIEETATGAAATLVLEPGVGGNLKTARKGVAMYQMEIAGRASHAGLDPEKGINALVEMSHQVLAIAQLGDAATGTSVTPTIGSAGSAVNVVPASGALNIDVRATSMAEFERVDAALHGLAARLLGAQLRLTGGLNRPPLPAASSSGLLAVAQQAARGLGLPVPDGVEVGGGSDGNFAAAVGCPTIDGLGPAGDGAHARGEHVLVDHLASACALVAGIVARLRAA